jgi:leucyl-tRNA synthetase
MKMEEKYFPQEIEEQQQARWKAARAFEVTVDPTRPKFYCLEMLPYPSGRIHMGHVRNYTIGDALSTFKRMSGFNVLHPMGWDAFGMPAENAAIKHGARPDQWTIENIASMRTQLERLGFNYDWSREVATCSPSYYRWNQWFLIKMWEKGLVYRRKATVNWCVKCNTSLANEQAEGGFCWRHEDTPVEQRELEQWFVRVTNYADELLDSLTGLEQGWPERVLAMQRNWIGRSRGAEIDFQVDGEADQKVRVFTTRIDTIYGVSSVILAPDHPLLNRWAAEGKLGEEVLQFREEQAALTPRERLEEGREKVGVSTGQRAINPFSGEKIPIWTANFVLTGYGTGAVMAVPGHDERDFEFSEKYGLAIQRVIIPEGFEGDPSTRPEAPYTGKGEGDQLIHSGEWSGQSIAAAQEAMIGWATEKGFGEARVNFKIRDWGISRQRAWGTPLPFIHCQTCQIVPVPEAELPVELPADLNFQTAGAPLAEHTAFVETVCPKCGGPARRDTDTMDTFVDSSWYYFRYCDPGNTSLPFAPEVASYWTPVDQYIGGIEHAVLHLIYTRVWTKIMRDLGLLSFGEPITRLLTQGMVCLATYRCEEHDWLHPDDVLEGHCRYCQRSVTVGRIEKMSKSKKNTIDPDEMIRIYGADTVRLFMLFAAPPEKDLEWSEAGAEGAARFLNRVWRLAWKWHTLPTTGREGLAQFSSAARALRRKTHQTIERVSRDLGERLNFNTAVAALMELTNELYAFDGQLPAENPDPADQFVMREALDSLSLMLAPLTPHFAEALWSGLGHEGLIVHSHWPSFDPSIAQAEELEIPIQLNGKLVTRLHVPVGISEEQLIDLAVTNERILQRLEGRQISKTIVVPGRLVNLVAR